MSNLNFSQAAYEDLKKELLQKKEARKAAVLDLSKARDMGDLSENGYYKSARMKLSDIDRRLRELSYLIKNARIYTPIPSAAISLGSSVTLRFSGRDVTYKIVGAYEADPQKGKISDVSPLGKTLLGKKVGERITITLPSGSTDYVVADVS